MKKRVSSFLIVVLLLTLLIPSEAFGASKGLSASQVRAKVPKSIKVSSSGYEQIKITLGKISGVDGIRIYRSESKNGTYEAIYTMGAGGGVYRDNGAGSEGSLKTGQNYYYKIRGFKRINGKLYYTRYSPVKYTNPKPIKPLNFRVEDYEKDQVYLKWTPVSGADGYQLSIREKGKKEWKSYYKDKDGQEIYPTSTKTLEEVTYVDTYKAYWKLDPDLSYEVRVRSYTEVDGEKVFGLYGDPIKIQYPKVEE